MPESEVLVMGTTEKDKTLIVLTEKDRFLMVHREGFAGGLKDDRERLIEGLEGLEDDREGLAE
ncbi:hypothetical protein DSO57_1018500 [Entomophthora muscae]|uniref:Uncharacterized protein n=1 Tax=Entomophthora muscae TaxID=34485 RepID=A0ACC2SHC4_9FUNG|nr:hypothetical protein DSO57_1018500 [Entomophthora muscae]